MDIYESHSINKEEKELLLNYLGRDPSHTEIGIFSVMWSEHCSYKSSRHWLKKLHTEGKQVIQGPGENAGVVDIGDNQAIIFKMESHNHPSFIEPYQGAATGVGGIMRDVFTMGARPIALLNSIRFGELTHSKTKFLLSGVVSGIGGYGNCVGIPTIAGETGFDSSYNGNNLVNAMCVGLTTKDKIFYSKASGVGNPVVYVGAKTGRDGIHGATMASGEFDDESEKNRPTVQVGDPYAEKLLLEACLELMQKDAIISIQDMGAAGLTSSSVEMADKGKVGIELNLDKIPTRQKNLTAYEMMLSESQERMLMVLKPEKTNIAEDVFKKWGVDFAIVGKITETNNIVVLHNGVIEADIPIKYLTDNAPMYKRKTISKNKRNHKNQLISDVKVKDAILKLLNSPNICSKKWIWEQYDRTIMANTLNEAGGDAGIVRIENTKKAIAMSCDVTPRYCNADAKKGASQAVAECWRNIISMGAKPLAITNCLNFGNPEKPEIMNDFVKTIDGIRDASIALDFPVVSGNVSLYNETNGDPIKNTPTIGGVGLIENIDILETFSSLNIDDSIYMLGKKGEHLSCSAFEEVFYNTASNNPPEIDLNQEQRNGEAILSLIQEKIISSCHDISDGGMIVAICEMIMRDSLGATIDMIDDDTMMGQLFGEDQSRYIITISPQYENIFKGKMKKLGIKYELIGRITSSQLKINESIIISSGELRDSYEGLIPSIMNNKA
ncbi:phosphoribosylformylglycinamidine synthase subunit PurL [Gammaproteobacteria bacterium]|nr:phosphoribosylformylglycinamidine synthase subunit PurL [Gammaproteobacteria bacterium]